MKPKPIKPTNDIVFKLLFGEIGRENILKDLLEAILDIKIERVMLNRQKEILLEEIDEKTGVLDIIAELPDKTIINIEMQNENYGNIDKRLQYYMSGIYVREMKKGQSYNDLKKVIVIGILNFDYWKKIKEYHTVWKLTEQSTKDNTLNEQVLHFIELPKFMRSKINMKDKLSQWLVFLSYERKELIEMALMDNAMVREAMRAYSVIVGDERLERKIFLREKYERDHNNLKITIRNEALEEGMQKGMKKGEKKGRKEGRKEGMQEGLQEGMQKGRQEGIKEGRKEELQKIVKNMKDSGMSDEEIVRVTKLPLEEIKKI